jgi:hypothetical protein
VPVLFLIAIVVVLVGIFFAATGRGGEMSYEPADHAPLDLAPVSAADVALLRPPTAMWGYSMQVTDEALDQIARAMRERDVTIAYLQEQLAGYEGDGSYAEPRGGHARQDLEASDAAEAYEMAGAGEPADPGIPAAANTLEIFGIAEMFEPRDTLETLGDTPETLSATPETPGGPEPSEAPESQEARQSPEGPEAFQSPEAGEPLDAPGPAEPAEAPGSRAGAEPPAEAPTVPQAPGPPRTMLVLKASKPEPHEATQPSQTLPDPDAAEPSAVHHDDEDSGEATQPSATLGPHEAPGPQGAFDTHGWWAEQKEAAREEQAHRRGSGERDDGSMAAAEEQGW